MSDNSLIPAGWAKATVGSIVTLANGFAFKPTQWRAEGIPIIRIQNLNNPDAAFNFCYDKLPSKFRVVDGDLLFAWSGTPGTSFGAHIWRGSTAWLNQHIFKVNFDDRNIDKQFLRLALNINLNEYIRVAHGGAGLAHITKGVFEASEVFIPPLAEQRRIVAVVDELVSDLDAGVAALKRAKANLKRYRAAVLKAAVEGRLTEQWRAEHPATESASQLLERILAERRQRWGAEQLAKYAAAGKTPPKDWQAKYVEPTPPDMTGVPELPQGWCWASVQQIGSVQLGRQRAPQHHNGQHMRPYLRVANVFEDRIDISDVMEMNFTPTEFETYKLFFGDILLNEGQSMELIGRPAMYRNEVPGACFTNTLVRFRPFDGVDANFALKVFLAYLKNGRFQKIATITVNIAHLGAGRFSEIEFPLPPMEEQAAIIEEVDRHFSLIDAAEKAITISLARAARLRQSILKRAFEGKLVPQDANDEPASVLLERIRASRHQTQQQDAEAKTSPFRRKVGIAKRHEPKGIFFKRGAVASYVVRRLANSPNFGRTQLAKVLYLTQAHLDQDLAMVFKRYPRGPFDEAIYKVEGLAKKQAWFVTTGRKNEAATYQGGPNLEERCQAATVLLSDKQAELDRLLNFIAGMNTDQAELLATVYAAWNDLLIDGRSIDNAAIAQEVYGWDESKRKFSLERINDCVHWIEQNGYVPRGTSQRTQPLKKPSPKGRPVGKKGKP